MRVRVLFGKKAERAEISRILSSGGGQLILHSTQDSARKQGSEPGEISRIPIVRRTVREREREGGKSDIVTTIPRRVREGPEDGCLI